MIKDLLLKSLMLLLGMLKVEHLKKAADAILDLIENQIDKSETQLDDQLVQPIIDLIRATFNIPDDD
ncbi:MAG: hypothetical protein ACYS1A_17935 [Planctomycetota bacterium]|jgi:hypothetical protein